MFRFLLIAFLVGWLFFKVFSFFIRVFVGGAGQKAYQNQQRQYNHQNSQRRTGDVHIDYIPQKEEKEKQRKDFKGGEYVDYEEVKDK